MTFRSKWYERGFYHLETQNVLSQIVVLYGAYLEYRNIIDDDASFISYYENNKCSMKEIFINTANRKLKKRLLKLGINASGRKMRRLYYTSKKRCVTSYSWIDELYTSLFKVILANETLSQIVYKQFFSSCSLCTDKSKLNYIKPCCVNNLLGFQYAILSKFSANEKNKKGKMAYNVLKNIIDSSETETIATKCLDYKKGTI